MVIDKQAVIHDNKMVHKVLEFLGKSKGNPGILKEMG